MLAQGKLGGVIYFARQGSDPATLRQLSDDMQNTLRKRERFTPGCLAIGVTGSEAHAEQVARAPKGKLPVSIPGLYPLGHGLTF